MVLILIGLSSIYYFIELSDFNVLKTFVSEWYDETRCLAMLKESVVQRSCDDYESIYQRYLKKNGVVAE